MGAGEGRISPFRRRLRRVRHGGALAEGADEVRGQDRREEGADRRIVDILYGIIDPRIKLAESHSRGDDEEEEEAA